MILPADLRLPRLGYMSSFPLPSMECAAAGLVRWHHVFSRTEWVPTPLELLTEFVQCDGATELWERKVPGWFARFKDGLPLLVRYEYVEGWEQRRARSEGEVTWRFRSALEAGPWDLRAPEDFKPEQPPRDRHTLYDEQLDWGL